MGHNRDHNSNYAPSLNQTEKNEYYNNCRLT